jgi:hypothetical protein
MELAKAFESFVAEPVRHGSIDLAFYRLSQLLHDRTNGKFDQFFMTIAPRLRPRVSLPAYSGMNSSELEDVVTRLRRDGYRILPFVLPSRDIEEIKSFAFSTPAFGKGPDIGVQVTPMAIPPGVPRFSWQMHDLARLPAVQRIVLQGPYCAIAQEYLGCCPLLVHVSLWLDAPSEERFEPYLYHYDNDGPAFLKFFLFLSDVADGTGAHHFVAGSHTHAKPASVARSGLYSDRDIFEAYSSDKEFVTRGPAGTILAEDTKGFHRGSAITRDFRLLLQLEFSVINTPTEQELAQPFPPVTIAGLDPSLAAVTRKFYSRA